MLLDTSGRQKLFHFYDGSAHLLSIDSRRVGPILFLTPKSLSAMFRRVEVELSWCFVVFSN